MERGVGLRVLEQLWGSGSDCEGAGRRSEGPGSGCGTGCEGLGCSGGSGWNGTGSGSEGPGVAAAAAVRDLAVGDAAVRGSEQL